VASSLIPSKMPFFEGQGTKRGITRYAARFIWQGALSLSGCWRLTNNKQSNNMKSMITNIVAAVFVAGLTIPVFAAAPGTGPVVAADQAKAPQYTCPMHAEVVKDAPGKCPKCGMKLVEKPATKTVGHGGCGGGGHGGCGGGGGGGGHGGH